MINKYNLAVIVLHQSGSILITHDETTEGSKVHELCPQGRRQRSSVNEKKKQTRTLKKKKTRKEGSELRMRRWNAGCIDDQYQVTEMYYETTGIAAYIPVSVCTEMICGSRPDTYQ